MSKYQTMTGEKHTLDVSGFSTRKLFVSRLARLLFKTKSKICDKKEIGVLRFEISSEKMNLLLFNHQICAADIRCLDANSKRCLKKLCLQTCLHNISPICPLSRGTL